MKKAESKGIERGQAITFRIPSDTPDHILKQLQNLKETERRNFSSKIAEFVLQGLSGSLSKGRESITVPLPKTLTKAQRDWIKHEHSEALLGSIIYQLLCDPVRSASLLAALNSNALDIEQALYLQEETSVDSNDRIDNDRVEEDDIEIEDDLLHFNWEKAKQEQNDSVEEEQEDEEKNDVEDLLGGFLAHMNK
jgi:hypothetical protein